MLLRILAILILFPLSQRAWSGMVKGDRLDLNALDRAYKESEWKAVTEALEGYLRNKDPKTLPVQHRIAAYKYLGTIYAADSSTHGRAENNFFLLFELSPGIELVDMYASKSVLEFFRNVKKDYQAQKEYRENYDVYGFPKGSKPPVDSLGRSRVTGGKKEDPERKPSRERKSNWKLWAAGAAVAAAAATFYALEFRSKKGTQLTAN